MQSLILAALIAVSPAPTFPPQVVPAYLPIPCAELVTKAGLAGKPITAENLGRIMATALRIHGYEVGKVTDKETVGKALVDFAGCFEVAPGGQLNQKPVTK